MAHYVLDFDEIDRTQIALVGGKGANLGELSRIHDIRVPTGFCVTTDAFRRIMANAPSVGELLDRTTRIRTEDVDSLRTASAELRRVIEDIAVPDDIAMAISSALARVAMNDAYAVRSSATTEDLPAASF